ncbi:SprT-like family protein [Rubritalea squalenifaciens DSM 18772]|uniref:SprT-like family protein n=1 Tax=Rubritalea squalenifaciens DSM 18772 TaxID=1123071 RepID=A0A1M6LWI2_9BACT|nr:SprT-like domain-containing protein [Rubritalea squalenifaciens]SHJ75493.1 SprT-like family protein [Rubritalea squalenifaciens DSM 18772]
MSTAHEKIVHAALRDILEQALRRLRVVGGNDLASKVTVVWNSRMRSTAGKAHWPEAKVELNPKLIGISLAEVKRTLLHELAHLLAYHRHKRRRIQPHGREWQQACADLGIPGESVTHNLALPSSRQRRKWRYVCPNCLQSIERVRKMSASSACYHCCQNYNGGKYHSRFRLKAERIA